MDRKLAHIEKVIAIEEIPGADKIELCKILGWQCVVKKGEFKVGDLAVYHEIDCITPEKPEYEFLRNRKFRIKTIRLLKILSQGLALPLSILPQGKYKEGQDCTELLGLRHYDPESPLNVEVKKTPKNKILKFLFKFSLFRKILLPFMRKEKGIWPNWLEHTDEPRIQNEKWILEKHKDTKFYVCEKLDGQSSTFFFRNDKVNLLKKSMFGVCSRNIWLKTEDNSTWWQMAKKYNLKNILETHFLSTKEELTINGEIVGPGIQKNKYGLSEIDLYVFNIINNRTNEHYSLDEMITFCKLNGLKFVPIVEKEFKLLNTIDEMLKYSEGFSILNNKTIREGIVIRWIEEKQRRISFKVINNEFLLKHGD